MADISTNQYMKAFGELHTEKMVLDNSAAQEVFEGTPMFVDISEDTSYIRQFVNAVTLATGDAFIGFAAEYCNVETTDTEVDNKIDVIRAPSIIGFAKTGLTRANIGDSIYMSDSGTFTTTAGSNLKVGTIHEVKDDWVYIQLEHWQSS